MIKIGTLCLVLKVEPYPELVGLICEVVSAPQPSPYGNGIEYTIHIPSRRAPSASGNWWARETSLRPLNDPDNAPAVDIVRKRVEPKRVEPKRELVTRGPGIEMPHGPRP